MAEEVASRPVLALGGHDDSQQYPGWRPFGGGEWQLVIKVMILQGGLGGG